MAAAVGDERGASERLLRRRRSHEEQKGIMMMVSMLLVKTGENRALLIRPTRQEENLLSRNRMMVDSGIHKRKGG